MKISVTIARIIVGVLFIFSGLVKANDPLGLSYKMQEFFELWGMTKFNSTTLFLSVMMNAFEIIAGFAILLGWRIRLFSWLILLLIIFFTFLTGYAYLSGKFRSCGCFGDCLPITPKTSFLKDLALLVLIGFLFWKQKWIRPIFSEKITTISMLGITIFAFGMQWYALRYLPFVDCLPYKKGGNITEKMSIPADAIPDVFETRLIYKNKNTGEKKDMSMKEFTDSKIWQDSAWKKDTMITKLVKKGRNNQPAIAGFVLTNMADEDSTQFILAKPYAIFLFCEDFSVPVSSWEKKFADIYATAKAKNIPAYLITTQPADAPGKLSGTSFSKIQVLKCDYTAIRTAARVNPCLYILEKGTIKGKWSRYDFSSANKMLTGFATQPASSNQ